MNGVFDWVTPNRDVYVSGFGQVDSIDAVDVDGDGFTEVAKRDLSAFGARAGFFLFGGNARLSFEYTHIDEDRRGGNNLDLPEFMADVAESIDSTLDLLSASWLHTVRSGFDYRVTLAYAHNERDTYYGAGMDPNAYGSTENPLSVFDSQVNRRLGSHYLSAGVQYNRDKLTDTQPAYDRYITETYTNLGLFLQDDWILGRGWELVYGARLDDFSEIDGAIVSPRVAVKYGVQPNLTSRLSVSSGFRGPQVFDEDLHITQVGGEGQVIRNDSDLKEESSLSTSLGLEWTPQLWGGIGLLEANLFNTDIDDLFLVVENDDPTTPEAEFTRINFGSAFVRGLELNLGWAYGDHFQIQLGFVLQRSELETPDPDFGSRTFFRTPNQYGVASVMWMAPAEIELWLGAKYTGSMKVPHYAGYIPEDRIETTDPYLTFDLRVAREFPLFSEPTTRFQVAVGGRNITDEFQQDLDQGPDRDSGYVYGPRFPRSWYVSLGLAF
jgi:outer membrane receptor for ferrienterochelin and colicins